MSAMQFMWAYLGVYLRHNQYNKKPNLDSLSVRGIMILIVYILLKVSNKFLL